MESPDNAVGYLTLYKRGGLFESREEVAATAELIRTWDELRARDYLRLLLVPSCSIGIDEPRREELAYKAENGIDLTEKSEYWRRLADYITGLEEIAGYEIGSEDEFPALPPPPWEGITWILDLVSDSPAQALAALESYIRAHWFTLPDGRLTALVDAATLIRARYIGIPEHTTGRVDLLLHRSADDLELLTAKLYERMGYEVQLTQRSGDGGKDVIASRSSPGEQVTILIECKRYSRPVGVDVPRRLLGVLSDAKIPKGVVVTTARFTRGARAFALSNPRLELVDGIRLALLLNEHLGHEWPLNLEYWLFPRQDRIR